MSVDIIQDQREQAGKKGGSDAKSHSSSCPLPSNTQEQMAGKNIQLMIACYETFLKYCSRPPSPAAQELQKVVTLSSTASRDFSSINLLCHFLKPCGLLSSHKQGWSAVLYYRRNGRTQSNTNSLEKQWENLDRPKGISGVVFKVGKQWNVYFHSGKPVVSISTRAICTCLI